MFNVNYTNMDGYSLPSHEGSGLKSKEDRALAVAV